MAEINQNVTIWTGNKVVISIDTNVVLTGATAEWAMKRNKTDTAVVLSKSSTDAISFTDEANGIMEITLSSTDTGSLSEGEYYHEARVTLVGGDGPYTGTTGNIIVKKSLFPLPST